MKGTVTPRTIGDALRIDDDGGVTVFTGKVELGQGIVTALAQIAAEELAVPLSLVRMAPTRTDRSPDEGLTAGSQSIEVGGLAIRLAGRHALRLLRAVAAEHLGCAEPRATGTGAFAAPDGERTVGYAALAPRVAWSQPVLEDPGEAPHDAPRVTGTPVPRIDLLPTITGAAFIHDLHWPDMLHGRVLRPPRRSARLRSLDAERVAASAGVVDVVRDGSFVAVVAEREDDALRALETARSAATWTAADAAAAPARARDVLAAAPTRVLREHDSGDPPAGEGTLKHEASYSRPFLAHASIGTSCAVARLDDGKLTVWSHSQGIFGLRAQLAEALDMDGDDVTVIHVRGAGCYGHNGADDVALDAALLARAVPGRPIRVAWSREDELAWSPVGSAMVIDVAAAVADARIVSWEMDLTSGTHVTRPGIGPGVRLLAAGHLAAPKPFGEPFDIPPVAGGGADRNATLLYDVPQRWRYHFAPELPLRTSALRTLGSFANVFAIESFMDELAAICGRDPVAFRLDHLGDERARAVVRTAADMAAAVPREEGVGLGLAFARYKNRAAYCAIVAEVDVREALHVRRLFCAVDAGEVINPDGLANQIEGGIVQAVSWTTKEQVGFRGDEITSCDWEAYPILRFAEVPEIELEVLERAGDPSLGIGEAVAGPTAAAIANAVADAIGFRMRDLPLSYATVARAIEDAALENA